MFVVRYVTMPLRGAERACLDWLMYNVLLIRFYKCHLRMLLKLEFGSILPSKWVLDQLLTES
jgi:hypothetical protein